MAALRRRGPGTAFALTAYAFTVTMLGTTLPTDPPDRYLTLAGQERDDGGAHVRDDVAGLNRVAVGVAERDLSRFVEHPKNGLDDGEPGNDPIGFDQESRPAAQ